MCTRELSCAAQGLGKPSLTSTVTLTGIDAIIGGTNLGLGDEAVRVGRLAKAVGDAVDRGSLQQRRRVTSFRRVAPSADLQSGSDEGRLLKTERKANESDVVGFLDGLCHPDDGEVQFQGRRIVFRMDKDFFDGDEDLPITLYLN